MPEKGLKRIVKINPLFDYKYRKKPVLIFVIKTALKILINLGSSTALKITYNVA